MTLHKLTSTNAFVVVDLDGAETASGVVRCAPKILQGGAAEMARSVTYSFASFELQRSGASAGINATPDQRDEAIAAFVAELGGDVEAGRLALDPAKGVSDDDLAPLRSIDPRPPLRWTTIDGLALRDHLAGTGPAVAASAALGGLEGRTAIVEGFGPTSPALVRSLAERGATIVGVSTASGAVVDGGGLDPVAMVQAWETHGDAMVEQLGENQPSWKINASPADVAFVGSKMGVIDDKNVAKLQFGALVPHGPLPYTTYALVALQRAGTVVLPDFLGLAAPLLADTAGADSAPEEVITSALGAVEDAVTEVIDHPEGAVMGACLRAEAFLSTWRDSLPFGRPLAS